MVPPAQNCRCANASSVDLRISMLSLTALVMQRLHAACLRARHMAV
jgi:hypothetical protein